ncbi:MAG: O-antigen ligase family protein [Thermomicrobiales bacterium]|nr:O-antigen ligase family protein [Thermomicrobiales bacterium]
MTGGPYRSLLAIGMVLVFFTNIANYGLRWEVRPQFWIVGFAAAAAPLALSDLLRRGLRIAPIGIWCFAYLLISFVWFVPSSQSPAAWQQIQTRLLSVIFLVLATYIFSEAQAWRAAQRAIVAAALLTAAINLYEVVFPMTFSEIPGRASGLFANVNQSGSALVLGLILGAGALRPGWRVPYALAVGLGILATVSRGALLGWALVLALWAARRGNRKPAIAVVAVAGLAVALLLLTPAWGGVQQTLVERGVLTENVRQRLDVFGGAELADASALERQHVAKLAWSVFAEHPLAGTGTGAATEGIFELGPHNMYLANMVDHGAIGIFILPTLLLAVVWGADPRRLPFVVPFVVFLAFWGFFSHNVLEERDILLAVAFVAAAVGLQRSAPLLAAGAS